MITARDVEFHTPPHADHRWAETYIFPIAIPEEHLLVMVYVVVRPKLGVMLNDIYVYGTLTDNRAELLYVDSQVHLPAPARMSEIDSPSGLKLKAVTPPRDWRIDYVGFDDTEIHVDWNGIMDPFDVHDLKHTPHATGTHEEKMARSGLSKAWNGHFDMTGRVTGTVRVRGTDYAVDSLERMDHSWGERGENDLPAMDSISAQFDERLAFHLITAVDLEAPAGRDQKLAHGYVLEDGVQHGVQTLEMTTSRLGTTPTSMHLRVTDVRGKSWSLVGTPDVGAPWNIYATTCWTGLMRWSMGERTGYGVVMEVLPLKSLTRLRGRRAAQWPAALTTRLKETAMTASADPGAALLADWRALTDERRDAPDDAWIDALRARYPTEREFDAMLTRRARRRTMPRRPGITLDEFRACLEAFLRDNVTQDFAVHDLRWMSGGGSKIQLTFRLDWADPRRGRCSERLVARLEPQESLSATSRRREAQLIEAFQGVLPVPVVRWVDNEGRWFPEPTLIYTFADGVTKPSGGGGRVSGVGSQFDARLRDQLGTQFIEHLARIHTLDPAAHEFSAFDIPRTGSTETALWQLNRARRIWDEDRTEEIPLMSVAAAWLQRHLPVLDRASVLHGDYRAGNFLFDEASGRITAWLDWERGYIGDRHRDLAWITLPLFGRHAEDGRTLLVSGLVPVEEFYRRYEEVSGLVVDRERLRYYRMLNNYQLIASTLGTAQRVARLGRSHQDVLLSWIEGAVYPLAADLRQHLQELI